MESKNMFETDLDYYFRKRQKEAIFAEMKYHGKLFCWHDYTNFNIQSLVNGQIKTMCKCVKCGKTKYSNTEVEYISNNLMV